MALSSARVTFATFVVLPLLSAVTFAEGFRIETKIYVGDDPAAVSETSTLFLDGVVYDFLKEPAQTAVFRKAAGGKPGRIILLDRSQQIRTELTTDQLAGAMDKLRRWASRQRDPLLKFAANPQFEESFDPGSGRLVLASHLESYRVDTAAADDSAALAEYREFLDWYTQLNTLLHAGPPPEPRLRLNAALERHNVIPIAVELTRAGDDEPLRAEHEFTWRLSRGDRAQIDQVRASLARYELVSNEDFLRSTQPQTEVE